MLFRFNMVNEELGQIIEEIKLNGKPPYLIGERKNGIFHLVDKLILMEEGYTWKGKLFSRLHLNRDIIEIPLDGIELNIMPSNEGMNYMYSILSSIENLARTTKSDYSLIGLISKEEGTFCNGFKTNYRVKPRLFRKNIKN